MAAVCSRIPIVGAEGETRDSIDRLVSDILDGPFADVQITLQTPFPGTGLYQRLKREKRMLEERAWSSYTLFDVTFQPDQPSIIDLEAAFAEAVREIYRANATSRRKAIRKQVWKRNPVFAAGAQR